MLQLPELGQGKLRVVTMHRERTRPRTMKVSAVSLLIAEHFAARRALRAAQRKLSALFKLHPDLEHRRPLIPMYTNRDGVTRYGRWVTDWDKAFTILKKESKKEPPERIAFREKCEAASIVQRRLREEAGIESAEDVVTAAMHRESVAWSAIIEHRPQSLAETQRQIRHVISNIEERHEGKLFERGLPAQHTEEEYRSWATRRVYALYGIETLLRSIAAVRKVAWPHRRKRP